VSGERDRRRAARWLFVAEFCEGLARFGTLALLILYLISDPLAGGRGMEITSAGQTLRRPVAGRAPAREARPLVSAMLGIALTSGYFLGGRSELAPARVSEQRADHWLGANLLR